MTAWRVRVAVWSSALFAVLFMLLIAIAEVNR
jgi:hypothetical protein